MSNYTNIYLKNKSEVKLLDTLNYTLEEFKKNPQACYPTWNKETMIASEIKYEYPIIDVETQELREKTREEKILLDNKIELLQDGEYIKKNEIIVVPVPENLIKATWIEENHTWIEGMTKDELVKIRTEKILKYSELENNKKALETSKFSSENEIYMIVQEMQSLEIDINNLEQKINVFKS